MIDLSPLSKAVDQLQSAMVEQAREPDRVLLRAGLIQTFEYTFELCHKMLRRLLLEIEPSREAVADLSFEGLIRRADELGLVLSPVATWKEFRQARNQTSHTYNEKKAQDVLSRIPAFAEEASFLLKRLEERTQSNG